MKPLCRAFFSSAVASTTRRPDVRVIAAVKNADGSVSTHADPSLAAHLALLRFDAKPASTRILADPASQSVLCVVGVGRTDAAGRVSPAEARNAAAAAVRAVRNLHADGVGNAETTISIAFDPIGGVENVKPVAEAAVLTAFNFTGAKTCKKKPVNISALLHMPSGADTNIADAWFEGEVLANAQNTARSLMETPANMMTPTIFCQRASSLFGNFQNVTVLAREKDWVESQHMGSFLSVARGSCEPLRFLEIHYTGDPKNSGKYPIGLVGKGVTFDTGGISIKPSTGMADMKGDMGGAAVVVGAMEAIVRLKLPINVVACIPLTENMPSGTATKPGDVVFAMNGKSIEVDNTDAEGRLILADAISYVCKKFSPESLVELSTLTGAMDVALGYPYAGVFTNSDRLWTDLEAASKTAGEGLWRMPMDVEAYSPQIKSNVADLKNVGGRSAGSCTAAVFLQNFVEEGVDFAHIGDISLLNSDFMLTIDPTDIAGVMKQTGSVGILASGMTGRPVRAIAEFVKAAVKNE
ncbi:hypothetical protein HDU83_004634 [Entophlyctis luteolus]|nr:hypothetical protein HDU83_004634 [Entophlyctis luteolus]